MEPKDIAFVAYALLMPGVAGWACRKEGFGVAAAIVFYEWLAGLIYTLMTRDSVPAGLFLLMDACACAWFVHYRNQGAYVFAATFALQCVLHLSRLVGWPREALDYWFVHAGSAFFQLVVLVWWVRRSRYQAAVSG